MSKKKKTNTKDGKVSSKELVELIKAVPSAAFKYTILEYIEENGITKDQWNFLYDIANKWLSDIKIKENSDEDD